MLTTPILFRVSTPSTRSITLHIPPPPRSTLFPYTTLFRSRYRPSINPEAGLVIDRMGCCPAGERSWVDRKSTRLNSSHVKISYAVFCLKKKNQSAGHVWARKGEKVMHMGYRGVMARGLVGG